MRKSPGITLLIFLAAACALPALGKVQGGAAAGDGSLTLDDGTTIPAPYAGFAWKKIQESTTGTPTKIYEASRGGVAGKVVLIVQSATADTDASRIAQIKAQYNALVATLQDGGYTDLKGTKPMLDPPIPDRAQFLIEGNTKAGDARVFRNVLIFGKCVYDFQVVATSEQDAATLAKIADAVQGSGPASRP